MLLFNGVYRRVIFTQTKEKDEEKHFRKVCKRLMESMDNGSCTLNWLVQNGSVKIGSVEINGKGKKYPFRKGTFTEVIMQIYFSLQINQCDPDLSVNESLAQQYYDELTQVRIRLFRSASDPRPPQQLVTPVCSSPRKTR